MDILTTLTLTPHDKKSALLLWNTVYPAQLVFSTPDQFDSYLNGLAQKTHHIATKPTGEMLAWAMTFEREKETWFALIVGDKYQRKGIGKLMLQKIFASGTELNGWVTDQNIYCRTDGAIYESPLLFYLQNGFKIMPECRYETALLSAVKVKWVPEQ
jgi:GNAT superfamily N-acetyltransferase